PDPISGMRAVPWDSPSFLLPVHHEHPLDAQPAQLDGGGQPCRPGADDQYIDPHVLRPVAGSGSLAGGRARASSSATAAPQSNPWQRPLRALVLRRRPSASAGGMVLDMASLSSPRVTRSQWQTISP